MPVSTSSSLSSRRSDRLGWVDVARGILILLVVYYHLSTVHAPSVTGPAGQQQLDAISTILRPFRMPLFFVISGFLAVGAIKRNWPQLLRSKVAFFYWIYLVWLLIQTLIPAILASPTVMAIGSDEPMGATAVAVDLLRSATIAPSNLWFLFALAIYFPLAKLLRGARYWALLPAFLLYLVSIDGWPDDSYGQAPAVAAYFFFFLAGSLLRAPIERFAARPRWIVVAAAVALFTGLLAFEFAVEDRFSALLVIESIAAVTGGIALAVTVSRHVPGLRRLLSFLGARTLPIYVLQMPLVWVWNELLRISPLDVHLISPLAVEAYVLGMTVVVTAVAVSVYTLLRRPLPYLFSPPPSVTGISRRTPAHRAAAAAPLLSSE